MLVFLSSALFSFAFSSPILDFPDAKTSQNCIFQLESFGATKNFGMNVAHGIHSITLRELRKLSPNITEDNRIPTINMNLSSADPILLYAPDRKGPSDGKFMTDGMRTLDEVLSHIGDEAYDIKNFNTLERIVHAFHMEEAWAMVEKAYEKIRKNPPNGQVCQCAMDIEHNGVLDKLRFIALAIREPELIYGDKKEVFRSAKKENNMGEMPAYTYQWRNFQENDQEKPAYTFYGRNPQENDQEKPVYTYNFRKSQENNQEKPAYTYQFRKSQEHNQEKPAYTYNFRKSQENNQEKPAYTFYGRNPQENDQEKPAYTYNFRKSQENNQEKPAYTYNFRKSQENDQEKPAYTYNFRKSQENNQEKPAYTFYGRNPQENDQEKPAYTYNFRKSQENNQEKPAYTYNFRKSQGNNQEKPAFIQHVNQNDMTQYSEKPAYTYQWRKHLEQQDDLNNLAFDQQLNKNTIFDEPNESLYPYRFKRNIDEPEKNQEKDLPGYYFPINNQLKKNIKVQEDSLPGYYFPFTNQLKTMQKSQSKNSTFKDQSQVLDQDNLLLRKDQSMPHLVGVDAWKKWKHISEMNPQEHVDAALFLYCALN